MSNAARREEMVRKFLDAKVFDFNAFGKFVAENGSSIATASDNEFGFIIGKNFMKYCIPPVVELDQAVEAATIRTEVTGR